MSLREQMTLDDREKEQAWDELQPFTPPVRQTKGGMYVPAYNETEFVERMIENDRRGTILL
jgi:hypothetical protein